MNQVTTESGGTVDEKILSGSSASSAMLSNRRGVMMGDVYLKKGSELLAPRPARRIGQANDQVVGVHDHKKYRLSQTEYTPTFAGIFSVDLPDYFAAFLGRVCIECGLERLAEMRTIHKASFSGDRGQR